MKEAFSSEETEAVLVDASNAFNALNRDAALHNIRHLCPVLSTILINIYCEAIELFVDGLTLASEEGTTQGDPLAMTMYALATIPLINRVGDSLIKTSFKYGMPMMHLLRGTFLPSDPGGITYHLLVQLLVTMPTPPKLG